MTRDELRKAIVGEPHLWSAADTIPVRVEEVILDLGDRITNLEAKVKKLEEEPAKMKHWIKHNVPGVMSNAEMREYAASDEYRERMNEALQAMAEQAKTKGKK